MKYLIDFDISSNAENLVSVISVVVYVLVILLSGRNVVYLLSEINNNTNIAIHSIIIGSFFSIRICVSVNCGLLNLKNNIITEQTIIDK